MTLTSSHLNNIRIRFRDPKHPIKVVLLIILGLFVFSLQLTSNPGGGHIGFRHMAAPGVIRLGGRQNSNGLGNMVLLEESEPKIPNRLDFCPIPSPIFYAYYKGVTIRFPGGGGGADLKKIKIIALTMCEKNIVAPSIEKVCLYTCYYQDRGQI